MRAARAYVCECSRGLSESGTCKLFGGFCLSLDLLIPRPVLFLLSRHPAKIAWCSLCAVTDFGRNAEERTRWFPLPGVPGPCLHLPMPVPLKMPLSSSREPSLTRLPLTALGATFQCQCLCLSLYLTAAAATHQGLPWCQTLS